MYFCVFILFLKIINFVRVTNAAELSLEIVKNVSGAQSPVSDEIEEFAGRNMTLTCHLLDLFNETTATSNDELSWGWKNKQLQFNNASDLEKLSEDKPNLFYHFLSRNEANKAAKHFQPLFPLESGTYFCMSWKYKLFKVVKLNVVIGSKPEDLMSYFKAMDESRANFKLNTRGPLLYPRFLCTKDKFICKSGAPCFDYEYVCDNVTDCKDGSDENELLCGSDPCAGKHQCSSGRCILASSCCNKQRDPNCKLCCSENRGTYGQWLPPSRFDSVDYTNDFTDNVHWNNYDVQIKDSKMKSLWTAVLCMAILSLVVISVAVRWYLLRMIKKRKLDLFSSASSCSSSSQSHYVVRYLSSENNGYLDSPPSYDELMTKAFLTPQKAND